MTCKTWLVVLVAVCVVLRLESASSTTVDGSPGIVESLKRMEWLGGQRSNTLARTSYLFAGRKAPALTRNEERLGKRKSSCPIFADP
jgi:hypothetical protein